MSICDENSSWPSDHGCNAARLYEGIDSRGARIGPVSGSSENNQYELVVYVWGTMDECVVRARIENPAIGLPAKFHGLPLENYTVTNIGWNVWEVIATYSWYGAVRVGVTAVPQSITLSTAGGKSKLTQSFWTVGKYPPLDGTVDDDEAPDFNRAIEWDGKNVNGIDVPVASPRYTETWLFPREELFAEQTVRTWFPGIGGQRYDPDFFKFVDTKYQGYMPIWTQFTGTVHGVPYDIFEKRGSDFNDGGAKEVYETYPASQRGGFRNWNIPPQGDEEWTQGSVLLSGVNVSQVSIDMFEVTFEFQINDETDVWIPNTVVNDANNAPVEKAGWDYLWMYYGKNKAAAKDASGDSYNVTASIPKYAYIEQIHPRVDFTYLGIGTGPLPAIPQGESPVCAGGSPDLMGNWKAICGNP